MGNPKDYLNQQKGAAFERGPAAQCEQDADQRDRRYRDAGLGNRLIDEKPPSEIMRQTALLDENLVTLGTRLDKLEQELSLVLIPSGPTSPQPPSLTSSGPSPLSTLGGILSERNAHVAHLVDRLVGITDRLTL